jgi:hypothetical protein
VTKSQPCKIHQCSKVDWTEVREDTADYARQFCGELKDAPVDDQWKSIENHLTKMVKTHVPIKMSKARTDQPWLTTELKKRCRKKQRMYNRWKKLKSRNKPCRGTREAYKRFHQGTTHLLQKARMQHINNILADGLQEKSQKPFWRYY